MSRTIHVCGTCPHFNTGINVRSVFSKFATLPYSVTDAKGGRCEMTKHAVRCDSVSCRLHPGRKRDRVAHDT